MICTVSFKSNRQNPLLNILIINCTRVYFDWLSITKPKPKLSQTYIDIIMIGCSIWLNTQTSLHWLWHNYLQNCTNRFSSRMTNQYIYKKTSSWRKIHLQQIRISNFWRKHTLNLPWCGGWWFATHANFHWKSLKLQLLWLGALIFLHF